jgi:uncharacterized membrane protein YcaP (DUF421 family)
MDLPELLGAPWSTVVQAVVSAIAIYLLVIAATRLVGLRTFAKMSAFDFATTIATGSIIASAAVASVPLATAAAAIVVLFAAQWVVARLRRLTRVDAVVDNRPVLLMDRERLLEANMRRTRITRDDLFGKLRAANVTRLEHVRAVVLETSGDISVLHAPDDAEVDDVLLTGVARDAAERLRP